MSEFSAEARLRGLAAGANVERSYSEFRLEIKVGGPAYHRLLSAILAAPDPDSLPHGTSHTHRFYGCDCLVCMDEDARRKRVWRQARKLRAA